MNTSEIMSAMIFGDGGASKVEELSTDGGSTDAGKVLVVGDNGKIAASDLTVGEGEIAIDKGLVVNGAAADAKKTGDAIRSLNGSLDTLIPLMNTVPVDTASGAVATFADGADDVPVKSLVVNIDPVQSGSGDPSPDNIRPISGWTGVNLTCNNDIINIDWTDEAGEVFGGTLDVLTGVLTVNNELITIDGVTKKMTGKWGDTSYGTALFTTGIGTKNNYVGSISNVFKYSLGGYAKMPLYSFVGGSGTNSTVTFIFPPNMTVDDANAWLAEMNNNGSPVIVINRLATPVTYQLTPQEVKTILGENNIFADTGDVSVEYRADIKLYISKVVATAVSALS